MTRSYLPHTPADRQDMLAAIGVKDVADLFAAVPAAVRLNRALDLPPAMAEPDLVRHLRQLAAQNAATTDYVCFRGGGAYDRFIPSVVDYVINRTEFLTAYTQYQAEIAQGYLQVLWEFQTMLAEITAMPVVNISLYDGGTALAEAAMLACTATGRSRVLVPRTVNPLQRQVMATYCRDRDIAVTEIPFALTHGVTDMEALMAAADDTVAAVVMPYPNFFGCVEDVAAAADLAHKHKALLVVMVDPIALGILTPPGEFGADIVVGEGQGMGLPLNFGGPYLGIFAATEKLLRRMPGRLVGQTTDSQGRRGFVLTLQAREQHIRREKATSNICSNEALCALAAAVYLAALGREGFQHVARLCLEKAHYAAQALTEKTAARLAFTAPFFQEFAVRLTATPAQVNARLRQHKIIGGLDLAAYYPELAGCMLLAVTEKRTRAEIDTLVREMGAVQ